MNNEILQGDVRDVLPTLASGSVHCIVTSPPYWGLRDYGTGQWEGGAEGCDHKKPPDGNDPTQTSTLGGGKKTTGHQQESWGDFCRKCGARRIDRQLGLEPTIEEYVANMVAVFRECRRILRDDGTLWLNLGDSYAGSTTGGGSGENSTLKGTHHKERVPESVSQRMTPGLKPKDLCMIPARVALALQADGWWLRSDIIWCLSGGVEVYARTQKGEMPTTIKDLVRLDPATVQLWNGEKWTQALGWSESLRPDKPIEIELRSGEKIGCTPGHQWPTQRGLLRADELKEGDILKSCRLPQPIPSDQPQFIPDDIGWFVGLYLAEGSKGKNGKVLQIASHIKEQDRFIRLKEIAEVYGGTCRMHKTGGNAATISLHGAVLIGIINQYVTGKTSHDKCLTSACWQRSDAFLWDVLSGYLDGDGHYDKKNDRWRLGFTRNYKLASNLRTICARLGVSIRLKLSIATNQDGTFKAFRGEIRFNRSNHHNSKSDNEIVRIGRSNARKFYDIGVVDEPHLFALASGVLTHNSKPNPMPESVTDRPTSAYEHVFLLTKSARYFYDTEAVREALLPSSIARISQPTFDQQIGGPKDPRNGGEGSRNRSARQGLENLKDAHERGQGRNRRNVWTIATESYSEAHFATFPTKLVEPCILAGTSARGCCPCGAPWERMVERETIRRKRPNQYTSYRDINGQPDQTKAGISTTTTGWRPTCECDAGEPVPAVCLDPFFGSGTVGAVAVETGRHYLGIELNPDYIELARRRIGVAQPALIAKGLE